MSQFQCCFDPLNKTWTGKKYVSVINPQVSLGHVLFNLMDRNPDKVVQICADTGIKYTNYEVRLRAIRTVQFFAKQGLQPTDVLGVVAGNSRNLAPIILACYVCGVPYNSLDISFGKNEITHMYGTTKPKIVFCDEVNYAIVKSSLEDIGLNSPVYIINGTVKDVHHVSEFMESGEEAADEFVCPILGDPQIVPAAIVCSSGTTGLPKGVLLSQAALVMGAELSPLKSNDVLLCFSTMYWYSGIWSLIVSLISGATRIVTTRKVSPELTLQLIDKYKVTFFVSPPSQMALLLQSPDITAEKLASVRTYLCGGSKVSSSLVHRMNSYLKNGKVHIMYGMTEAGTICTVNPGNEPLESVGLAYPNMQMKIVNDKGDVVDVEVDGEVFIKPPNPFLGYWGRPEESKAIFDKDGWIHSGDVGHFDKNGYLILVDRKKDILKFRNYHYFPSEIENILMEIPDIAQSCVCGIQEDDGSDLPAVLIVKTKGSKITEQDIFDYTAARLADYKHLKGGIYFTDSIPMTASGKYMRRGAREICTKLYRSSQVTSSVSNLSGAIKV